MSKYENICYAATNCEGNKTEYFVGDADKDGKEIQIKIRCPNGCNPIRLSHKNWYASKEYGEQLIIECGNCGKQVNSEDDDELSKWVVEI